MNDISELLSAFLKTHPRMVKKMESEVEEAKEPAKYNLIR